MYKGKRIAVVIPAYNEREFIGRVIETVPNFVDRIYAVNDASTDDTGEILARLAKKNKRLTVINRKNNGGVGAAVISGYKIALRNKMDIIARLDGDGQMDLSILKKIIAPIIEDTADFTKGDRLSITRHRKGMSVWRTLGNFLLTYLTKIASGYWHMIDPQNGYTAISNTFLQKLDLDKIEKGFAFENDLIVKLNVLGARLVDVPHRAIYGKERSKIRYHKYIVNSSWVLLKLFLWRLKVKYLDRKIFGKT